MKGHEKRQVTHDIKDTLSMKVHEKREPDGNFWARSLVSTDLQRTCYMKIMIYWNGHVVFVNNGVCMSPHLDRAEEEAE